MTDTPLPVFAVPYAGAERQSFRVIAASLRSNALAGFPPRAFEEKAVTRRFLHRHQVILSEPAGIRHVLVDNADNYRRTASVERIFWPIIGNGLFLAEGDSWRAQRRIATPAFAAPAVARMTADIAQICDRLVAALAAEQGRQVDLLSHLQLLSLEVAARGLFSVDLGAEAAELRATIRTYAAGLGRPSILDFMLPRFLPAPQFLARWRFRRQWMRRVAEVVAARAARRDGPANDLYDLLAADGPDRLVERIATMLVAGHETTAVALFWALYLTASAPAVQQRVAAEAATLDLGPEGAAASLPQLVYARAVAQEALRLFPPAFSIVRQARAADRAGEIEIPRRAVLLIVPWVLHRHRLLWPAPDRFDPERFLPGRPPPERFSYLPFGAGPRSCIGAQLALTETTLVLARLVQAFRIQRADSEPVLPRAVITLQPDRSPPFRLTPR